MSFFTASINDFTSPLPFFIPLDLNQLTHAQCCINHSLLYMTKLSQTSLPSVFINRWSSLSLTKFPYFKSYFSLHFYLLILTF